MDKSTSNRGNFNKILGVLHDREYEDVSKSSLSIFTTVRDWECTKRMYSFHLVCFFSCSTIYSCHYDNMSSSKIIIKQIITHAMTFSACAQTQTMSILCVCVVFVLWFMWQLSTWRDAEQRDESFIRSCMHGSCSRLTVSQTENVWSAIKRNAQIFSTSLQAWKKIRFFNFFFWARRPQTMGENRIFVESKFTKESRQSDVIQPHTHTQLVKQSISLSELFEIDR